MQIKIRRKKASKIENLRFSLKLKWICHETSYFRKQKKQAKKKRKNENGKQKEKRREHISHLKRPEHWLQKEDPGKRNPCNSSLLTRNTTMSMN